MKDHKPYAEAAQAALHHFAKSEESDIAGPEDLMAIPATIVMMVSDATSIPVDLLLLHLGNFARNSTLERDVGIDLTMQSNILSN